MQRYVSKKMSLRTIDWKLSLLQNLIPEVMKELSQCRMRLIISSQYSSIQQQQQQYNIHNNNNIHTRSLSNPNGIQF